MKYAGMGNGMTIKVKCSVCYTNLVLNSEGNVPKHIRPATKLMCEGIDRAPLRGVPVPFEEPLTKPLPDSKADFEISLKWNVGQPGTGRRR